MTTSTQPTASAQEPALSSKAFEIMRHAVTLARNNSIQKVATLRVLLQQAHPGCDSDIDSALKFWANHAKRSGSSLAH